MTCPRSHRDLRFRRVDIKIEDLPESLRLVYEDAVERGCGCDMVPRYIRATDFSDDAA